MPSVAGSTVGSGVAVAAGSGVVSGAASGVGAAVAAGVAAAGLPGWQQRLVSGEKTVLHQTGGCRKTGSTGHSEEAAAGVPLERRLFDTGSVVAAAEGLF